MFDVVFDKIGKPDLLDEYVHTRLAKLREAIKHLESQIEVEQDMISVIQLWAKDELSHQSSSDAQTSNIKKVKSQPHINICEGNIEKHQRQLKFETCILRILEQAKTRLDFELDTIFRRVDGQ